MDIAVAIDDRQLTWTITSDFVHFYFQYIPLIVKQLPLLHSSTTYQIQQAQSKPANNANNK